MSKAFIEETRKTFHQRLCADIPFYARWCLKIRTKSGSIDPFILNRAQEYLHDCVEKQLQATGKVRCLILKGRQQGMSTYIAGRFYHKTTHNTGKATFILSHEASTTEKLFGIVERMHKLVPDPVKMDTDVANRRRMLFAGLGSEYFVGTAGNEEVGRGGTVQYLHASEAAFYPANSGFSKGLLQSVPDAPGTEVFMESTACGMDSLFYPACMNALQGKGEYQLIFIPWFWQAEYRKLPEADFVRTEEEQKLAEIYGLDDAQLNWRRSKIFTLKEIGFMQEYPNSVEEAFTVSGESLIPAIYVMQSRKATIEDRDSPLVIGADPNEAGGDVGIVWRRGRHVLKTQIVTGKKPMELVGLFASIIENDNPAKMFLDNGNGYGIIDRLVELGYSKVCTGVDFGGGAVEEDLYLNKRVEMADAGAKWFINGGTRIPDDDLFQKHLCCVPPKIRTSSERVKLESKPTIIKNTLIDPHLFDAFILTFAYPIASGTQGGNSHIRKAAPGRSPLKTTNRRREIEKEGQHTQVASVFTSI